MNTTIYLGSVKWNNKYTHVVDFQTETKRRAWFMHNFIEHAKTTKLLDREQGELETDVLTYNEMLERGYNYMYVEEFDERVDKTFKWFAFIVALERTNKDTVIIRYEIDYWQTYFFKPNGEKAATDILDAFVKREHQDRWTRKGNVLSPIWSRTIEGIEVGDMVKTNEKVISYDVFTTTGTVHPLKLEPFIIFFDVVSASGGENFMTRTAQGVNGFASNIKPFIVFKHNSNKTLWYRPGGADSPAMYKMANFNGQLRQPNDVNVDEYIVDYEKGYKRFATDDTAVISIVKVNYLPFSFKVVSEDEDNIYISLTSDSRVVLLGMPYGTPSVHPDNYIHALQVVTLKTSSQNRKVLLDKHAYTIPHYKPISIMQQSSRVFEPKLLTQEFMNYKLTSMKSEPLTLVNENIVDDTVYITIRNSLDIWNNEDVVLEGYNNNDFYNRLRTKNNAELTIATDTYKEYINNNRNQIAVSQTLGGITVATGIASGIIGGGLIGADKLGMGLGLIAGGVHQTQSGLGGIFSELARQNDYKNKVDEVRGTQNTVMLDAYDEGDKYRLTKYQIREPYMERVYSLFLKQGYLANEYKKPILDSRYYYNYIQCSYVELNPQAIPQDAVRRIIESIYLNGTTIWHYRNPSTFRLIDYSLENWEMSLIGQ